MKELVCPECGSSDLTHYTNAFVLRDPVLKDDGSLELLEVDTLEYEKYFQCFDCGHRPSAEALIACGMETGASKRSGFCTAGHGTPATAPHS